MEQQNINLELDLRHWLKENVDKKARIQWIEPGKYGSSIGAPDCYVHLGHEKVGIETKYFVEKRRGIMCKVRPVQRRWHHIAYQGGTKCAILAAVVGVNGEKFIILIRGDKVPKRDYADDESSGCKNGKLEMSIVTKENLNRLLFDDSWGFWD